MRRTIVGLLIGAINAPLMIAPAPAGATFPGGNGRIAYTRHAWEDTDQEIYVISPRGRNRHRLTENTVTDISPSFSPDGRTIVWACLGEEKRQPIQHSREICAMRADGSNKRRLTNNNVEESSPSWAPGGREIVFSRTFGQDAPERRDIFKMRVDGKGEVLLTPGDEVDGQYPEWSPDGRLIAFWGTTDDQNGIYTMRAADGSDLRLLIEDGLYPSWSPSGKRIVFEMDRRVAIMNRDGSRFRYVTKASIDAQTPSWSPNGRWIVFTKELDDLFKIRLNGSGLRRITGEERSSRVTEVSPDWQATFGGSR